MFTINDIYNKQIIINNDFDGILCGDFLQTNFNCKVIGWTNSKDKLYIKKGYILTENTIFIDIFTPQYMSIDQHITPYIYENSLNPNMLNNVFVFDNYNKKYPFSTFLFILTLSCIEGIDIKSFIINNNLYKLGDKNFYKFDIFLRADDTLYSTVCAYKENCQNWWNNIVSISNNNFCLKNLFNFIYSLEEEYVKKWKSEMKDYFEKKYNIINEELPIFNETNKSKIKEFLSHFNLETAVDDLLEIKLVHKRVNITNIEEFQKIINNNQIFSYAFPYSPRNINKKNFSYTTF